MRNLSAFRYCVLLGTAVLLSSCSDLAYDGLVDVCLIPPGDSDEKCTCTTNSPDDDGDGVPDCAVNNPSECPAGSLKQTPGVCGCDREDTDADGDGTPDCRDMCPKDPKKSNSGVCGCGASDEDADGNGIIDCVENEMDLCPEDPEKNLPGICGCGASDEDADGNGVIDCIENEVDLCPEDPDKTLPGVCGCGASDEDADGNGVIDCIEYGQDFCPGDPDKIYPGVCGCGASDEDADGNGVIDCLENEKDLCPGNPDKNEPGICGCGVSDVDSDGDTIPDCIDQCPGDKDKIGKGICGCGVSDVDSDGDTIPDCIDECPDDENKVLKGKCDCGNPETADCGVVSEDLCPDNPNKTAPGNCGCNVMDIDGGCDDTFHIYKAGDLFTYKGLKDNCDAIPTVVLHGKINLFDHFQTTDTQSIGNQGDCNPMVFIGEKYQDQEPEIVFENGSKHGKISSPLFWAANSKSVVLYASNLKLSYDVEGDVRGILANYLDNSVLNNVHYKGAYTVHVNKRLVSTGQNPDYLGGLAGLFKGSAGNVSFTGTMNVDMAPDSSQVIGYLGGIFGNAMSASNGKTGVENIHFKGNITIKEHVNAQNVGGIAGRANIAITNAVFENGMLTYKPGPFQNQKYKTDTCIGGIAGDYSSSKITGSVLKEASIMADSCGNVGGIVGCLNANASVIGNCEESKAKTIKGFENVGGIVGKSDGGKILKVKSTVSDISANRVVGGFGGFLKKSEVRESTSNVKKVSGSDYVGGFAGQFAYNTTVGDIDSTVETVQAAYDSTVDFEKDIFLRLCAGGFASFILAGDAEKTNASFANIQSKIKTISSSLGTKVSGKNSNDSGTGGFVGCLVLGRTDSEIHLSKIYSTTDKLESANHTAGFAGDVYMVMTKLENFKADNAFFWSNITNANSNAHNAGIMGGYGGDGKYGIYTRVVSVSRYSDDQKVLYAFNNIVNSSTDLKVLTDKKFYYYLWNDKTVAYPQNDVYSKFVPFDSKNEHGESDVVRTKKQVLDNLNENNNKLWRLENITVGDQAAQFPVFTATAGCK